MIIIFNKFFYVSNHAFKRFIIEVLINFINSTIIFIIGPNFSRVTTLEIDNKLEQIKKILELEISNRKLK